MNYIFSRFSTRQLVAFGLIVAVLFTLLVGWLQYQTVMDLHKTRDLVRHTRLVQLGLKDFGYSVSAAESCQLEYLLTHDQTYLDNYNQCLINAENKFQALRMLITDSADQQKNLDAAAVWYKQKLDFMGKTIALEQSGNHAGALQMINTNTGKKTMDSFLDSIQTLQDIVTILLLQRQQIYQDNFKYNTELSSAILLLCVGFIGGILLLVRRMEHLQSIVTLCALTEMIEYEGGSITIEEYLRRRHQALYVHGKAQIEAERLLGLLGKIRPRMSS